MHRFFLLLASFLGAAGVALGAFGAHYLKSRLSALHLETYEVAVRYQLMHALALGLVALLSTQISSAWLSSAGWSFGLGTLLFSGSLYLLIATGAKIFGPITPIGGLLLILGWIFLGLAALSA